MLPGRTALLSCAHPVVAFIGTVSVLSVRCICVQHLVTTALELLWCLYGTPQTGHHLTIVVLHVKGLRVFCAMHTADKLQHSPDSRGGLAYGLIHLVLRRRQNRRDADEARVGGPFPLWS